MNESKDNTEEITLSEETAVRTVPFFTSLLSMDLVTKWSSWEVVTNRETIS